jgi:flagellin
MPIGSLSLLRFLDIREKEIGNSVRRVSSGLRVNRVADEPVALSISCKLNLQIRKNIISIDNINNGISMIRTAEGAMSSINAILNRMRVLVLKTNNDTLTDLDREKYQYEINQLLSEIDNIARSTQYNNKKLLDGSLNKSLHIIEGREYLDSINTDDANSSFYDISVISGGEEHRLALTFKTSGEILPSTSLYTALGEVSSISYYKTLTISNGSSKVEVKLEVNPSGDDTISSTVEKLNNAFLSNGMNIIASFDQINKSIILASTEPGAKYTINIEEINSIEGAINFSDTPEVVSLEGPNGQFSYKRLNSITGAISGPSVDGGTLVKNYFGTSSPLTFQFKGFGGSTFILDIPISYTLDYTAFYIKNQLKDNLGIDVNVVFDGTSTDSFKFLYSNPEQRLELSIIGGTHQENYTVIEATEGTLLGNVLDLQDELSMTFLDQSGPLITVNFSKNSSIQDVINSINNTGLNINASFNSGVIKIDQSSRVSKIFEILQDGTDSFLVKKEIHPSGYTTLNSPEDVIISLNEKLFASSWRGFDILGLNFTLTKDALESLATIKFQISSGTLTLFIEEEKVDISLPDLTLQAIGLDNIDIIDIDSAVEKIDKAIEKITSERVRVGTYENILGGIIQNLEHYKLSLSEAKSRITDVDIAKELSNLIKNRILYDANVTLLINTQALSSEEVLSLIQ